MDAKARRQFCETQKLLQEDVIKLIKCIDKQALPAKETTVKNFEALIKKINEFRNYMSTNYAILSETDKKDTNELNAKINERLNKVFERLAIKETFDYGFDVQLNIQDFKITIYENEGAAGGSLEESIIETLLDSTPSVRGGAIPKRLTPNMTGNIENYMQTINQKFEQMQNMIDQMSRIQIDFQQELLKQQLSQVQQNQQKQLPNQQMQMQPEHLFQQQAYQIPPPQSLLNSVQQQFQPQNSSREKMQKAIKIVPTFNGKWNEFSKFMTGLELFKMDVQPNEQQYAVKLVMTKVDDKVKLMMGQEPSTIDHLIELLNKKVKGEDVNIIKQKLQNCKQNAKSNMQYLNEMEELANNLKSSYVRDGLNVNLVEKYTNDQVIQTFCSNMNEGNLKNMMQAAVFTNFDEMKQKFLQHMGNLSGSFNIQMVNANDRKPPRFQNQQNYVKKNFNGNHQGFNTNYRRNFNNNQRFSHQNNYRNRNFNRYSQQTPRNDANWRAPRFNHFNRDRQNGNQNLQRRSVNMIEQIEEPEN